jgi:hypothetical protein
MTRGTGLRQRQRSAAVSWGQFAVRATREDPRGSALPGRTLVRVKGTYAEGTGARRRKANDRKIGDRKMWRGVMVVLTLFVFAMFLSFIFRSLSTIAEHRLKVSGQVRTPADRSGTPPRAFPTERGNRAWRVLAWQRFRDSPKVTSPKGACHEPLRLHQQSQPSPSLAR